MKEVMRRGLLLGFLASTAIAFADSSLNDAAIPYFSIRSQSEDSARELVGWAHKVNLYGMDRFYGTVAITPEYTNSFDSFDIAKCIFGKDLICDCDCPFIRISGSRSENRNATDWMADYFGLPTDYRSTVFFQPRVTNFLVDINFYFGFDNWFPGLFFRVHAPIVNTRWKLGICECIEERGRNIFPTGNANPTLAWPQGYFNNNGVAREDLLNSFREYVSGCRVPALGNTPTSFSGPTRFIWDHLRYGKMVCQTLVETQVAEIQAALGWNFWQSEDYHVGASIRTAAPTGTRPDGEFLFEPVVGNGKHWELGGGLTMHYTFWRNEDESKSFGIYSELNITHLFQSRQRRSFDLLCRPNSRYALAMKFTPFIQGGLVDPNGVVPVAQFRSIYAPVINLTTFDVDVSASAQVDFTLMFDYRFKHHWDLDLGYNLWVRTCEQIECKCCPPLLQENTWVLKGDEQVIGFTTGSTPIPLSASQNCSDIHKGTFFSIPAVELPTANNNNERVDNARIAAYSGGNLFVLPSAGGGNIYSSFQPRFINIKDIDLCSARTKGLSHKFFINLQRSWDDHDWQPYFGVGGKVEVADFKPRCEQGGTTCLPCDSACISNCDQDCRNECFNCDTSCCCEPCTQCSLSEWGIWLKGGVSY